MGGGCVEKFSWSLDYGIDVADRVQKHILSIHIQLLEQYKQWIESDA